MGYNSKVTKHSYGISGRSSLGKTSNGIDAREYMASKMKREQQAVLEASIQERDNVVKQVGLIENVNARRIGDKQASFIIGDMTKAGRDYAFKYAMGVIFENCLLLDDYYVKENSTKIRGVMESYIDNNGGITLLENALKTNKTRFLTMLMEACNKTASKCAKRKLKEAQEAGQTQGIKFDITDEEREELDTEIQAMDVEQLSSVVKDKVLTVIKEEKERAQQREEFERDLADGVEDAIVKEQTFRVHNNYCSAKDTLFNAFMTESYKDVLESVVQFDFDSCDEVDEIGLDSDEVDYDDNSAHSLSELNRNNDISTSKFKGSDNFREIPDEYDESLSLGDMEEEEALTESEIEEFLSLVQEEMVFEANGLADLQMKTLNKQAAAYDKRVRKIFMSKNLKELKILQDKKKAALADFKNNLDNYQDKNAINKAANTLLLFATGLFTEFLPAKYQTRAYLRKLIWVAEHDLKVLAEVIKEKEKSQKVVKESTLEDILTEASNGIVTFQEQITMNSFKANAKKQQESSFKHYSKKSLDKLEKLRVERVERLHKFENQFNAYDDSSKIIKGAKTVLQLACIPGLMSALPANLQSKVYLDFSIWLAKEDIKAIDRAIALKKTVKESFSDLMDEFEIQLEGFGAIERAEVIGLCQRNTFEALTEASLEAEELVYSLESKLAKERAKSDEEKEKELEEAEFIYGQTLAKNYVGESKVVAELESARRRHRCIEKAIELKPGIAECKGDDCEPEEEGLLPKPQLRKKAKKVVSKVKKKAIVMDQVMAEALTKYTLLETLYTVKLENYTVKDVMDLSVRLTSEK